MSAQGVLALTLAAVGLVVTVVALVLVLRRLSAARQHPVVSSGMTMAQRRRAMRQIRRGEVVADDEVAGVRAVAREAAGNRLLALVFAGTTVVFAAQALLVTLPTALRALDVVVAAIQAAVVVAFLHVAARARDFLRAHPDPAPADGASR